MGTAADANAQRVRIIRPASYIAMASAVALAQNKSHLSIVNAAGSGKKVKIQRLLQINDSIAAVTGVGIRYDVKRITGHSAGTDITVEKADTANADLSNITIKTGSTVSGEGNTIFPITVANDENPLTGVATANDLRSALNYLPHNDDTQPITLRAGEGLSIKQITNSVVGAYNWVLVITVEEDNA